MTTKIDALVLNTKQELQSFPLNQAIKIKFSEQVEDSQLMNCIALIRNISETGLFNISEKYNQSIGYIREKFDVEDVRITVENNNGFIVTITPVKPLSPGFDYTLYIDKGLSSEFISVSKPTTMSSSTIEAALTVTDEADLSIEIISDPKLTATTNIIKAVLTDNIKQKSETITLDLKITKTYSVNGNIKITFTSMIYVKGEVFSVLSIPSKTLEDNLFVQIRTALTANVKPIETEESFTSISNEDILAYYQNKTSQTGKAVSSNITYTGLNKFVINLPEGLKAEDLDLDAITFETSEAFGLYTLEMYKLYDPLKTYTVTPSIKDSQTILITVEEV